MFFSPVHHSRDGGVVFIIKIVQNSSRAFKKYCLAFTQQFAIEIANMALPYVQPRKGTEKLSSKYLVVKSFNYGLRDQKVLSNNSDGP